MPKTNEKIITAFFLICALLIFGTVAYHQLESWSYLDSLYFTSMTITTVGYGDLYPTTDASKVFTILFSFTGISIALVILFSIGRDYYEREQLAIRTRIQSYLENKKIRLRRMKAERRKSKSRTSKRRRFLWVSRRKKLFRRK